MTGRETIRNAQHASAGYLTDADVADIAADPETRLTLLLVRCGGGRFLAPADQVQTFINIIERDYAAAELRNGPGAEDRDMRDATYVRDVSLPHNVKIEGDAPRRVINSGWAEKPMNANG